MLATPSDARAPTSVYVHFPFCARKCPYCDFATRAIAPAEVPSDAYRDAVLRELEARAPALEQRALVSIFFGGGTPSLWAPEALGEVRRAIAAAFGESPANVEVTVECNPSSFDEHRAAALAQAGVSRISLGVQSLDDARLRFLGRLHDANGAIRALHAAMSTFARVSADLMFGMPDETAEDVIGEVDRLLDLGFSHLSVYALTIESGTQFGELARLGKLRTASEDDFARMFEGVAGRLADAGLEHYEVSNYARPGERSAHNAHYWRGGAYLGLGAAAVGCLDIGPGRARRWRNEPEPSRYLASPREEWEEHLGPDDLVREGLMLGLRTSDGVDLAALAQRAGKNPREGREAVIARRAARGDLVLAEDRIRVPEPRWLHLDGIVADLF